MNCPNSLLAACLFAATVSAQAPTPDQIEAIDHLLADWSEAGEPGGAVAVVHNGELVYSRCRGIASGDALITAATPFYVASVAKQFTAACILDLVERGELGLADPVAKHVPELPEYAKAPTVRDLLDHRSGIRDFYELGVLAGWDLSELPGQQVALELVCRQRELNFEPGSSFCYSNSGYLLLAEIVRRVSGQGLREYAAKRLFDPLGMKQAAFRDAEDQVIAAAAVGHAKTGTGFRARPVDSTLHGPGGMYASLDDLVAWAKHLDARRETLLDGLSPRELGADQRRSPFFGAYAGGFMVRDQEVYHGGEFPGQRTHLQHAVDARLSVIVLSNREDGAAPANLAARIEGVMLDEAEFAVRDDLTTEVPGGVWFFAEQGGDGVVMFGVQRGRGVLKGLDYDLSMRPTSATGFTSVGTYLPLVVRVDLDGRQPVGLSVGVKGETARTFEPIARDLPDAEDLAAVAGTYRSEELERSIELVVRGGRLGIGTELSLPMSPFNSVTPDLHFAEPRLMVRVVRDEDGTVEGLRVSTKRARNVWLARVDRGE